MKQFEMPEIEVVSFGENIMAITFNDLSDVHAVISSNGSSGSGSGKQDFPGEFL